MICINFQVHNLQYIDDHSVVKIFKNCGPEFFKIKLTILCAKYIQVMLMQYGTAQMQRPTRSTTRCSLHARTQRLPSRVCKLAAQKSLYTWFTTKLL